MIHNNSLPLGHNADAGCLKVVFIELPNEQVDHHFSAKNMYGQTIADIRQAVTLQRTSFDLNIQRR